MGRCGSVVAGAGPCRRLYSTAGTPRLGMEHSGAGTTAVCGLFQRRAFTNTLVCSSSSTRMPADSMPQSETLELYALRTTRRRGQRPHQGVAQRAAEHRNCLAVQTRPGVISGGSDHTVHAILGGLPGGVFAATLRVESGLPSPHVAPRPTGRFRAAAAASASSVLDAGTRHPVSRTVRIPPPSSSVQRRRLRAPTACPSSGVARRAVAPPPARAPVCSAARDAAVGAAAAPPAIATRVARCTPFSPRALGFFSLFTP